MPRLLKELLPVRQGVPVLPSVAKRQLEKVINIAAGKLDIAIHIGFAEFQVRVESDIPDHCVGFEPQRHRFPGSISEFEVRAVSKGDRQIAAFYDAANRRLQQSLHDQNPNNNNSKTKVLVCLIVAPICQESSWCPTAGAC